MSHRFRFAHVVLAIVVCSFVSGSALAQTGQNFGELVGKVVDDQGAVLPGVPCVRIDDVDLPRQHRLHFTLYKHHPRFVALFDFVIEFCTPILRD